MTVHSEQTNTATVDIHHDDKAWCFAGNDKTWKLKSNAGDDIFFMPGTREIDRVTELPARLENSFTVSVKVNVSGSRFADAAGLLLRTDNAWIKFCIEFDTKQNWRVVSIYSNPVSDESYSDVLINSEATLILTRDQRRIALWYSTDGNITRQFVRTFHLPSDAAVELSCFTQAPFSESTEAVFSEVFYSAEPMKDKR